MFPAIQHKSDLIKANIASQFSVAKKQCVANILLNNKKEILLLKRSGNDSFHPSTWCLAGGGIDFGEKPLDAVRRETMEETGIDEDCYSILNYKKISVPKVDIHYFISILHLDDEAMIVLDEGEHQQYVWASYRELKDFELILDLEKHLISILGIKFV